MVTVLTLNIKYVLLLGNTIAQMPPYTKAMLLVWMNIPISDDDQLELGCELRNSPKAMNMNPPRILKPANMYPSVLQTQYFLFTSVRKLLSAYVGL